MNEFHVRRLPEGPIDVDFYRNQGKELRLQAIRDARRVLVPRLCLAAGAALALLVLVASVSAPRLDSAVVATNAQPR